MWVESRCEKRGGCNVVRRWQLPLRGPQESLSAAAGKIRNCGGMGGGVGTEARGQSRAEVGRAGEEGLDWRAC